MKFASVAIYVWGVLCLIYAMLVPEHKLEMLAFAACMFSAAAAVGTWAKA